MMRLVPPTDPIEAAWSEYNRATLDLRQTILDPNATAASRLDVSQRAARTWAKWRDLFLKEPGNG